MKFQITMTRGSIQKSISREPSYSYQLYYISSILKNVATFSNLTHVNILYCPKWKHKLGST